MFKALWYQLKALLNRRCVTSTVYLPDYQIVVPCEVCGTETGGELQLHHLYGRFFLAERTTNIHLCEDCGRSAEQIHWKRLRGLTKDEILTILQYSHSSSRYA